MPAPLQSIILTPDSFILSADCLLLSQLSHTLKGTKTKRDNFPVFSFHAPPESTAWPSTVPTTLLLSILQRPRSATTALEGRTTEHPARRSAKNVPKAATTTKKGPRLFPNVYCARPERMETKSVKPSTRARACARPESTAKRGCGNAFSAGRDSSSRRAKGPAVPTAYLKRPP